MRRWTFLLAACLSAGLLLAAPAVAQVAPDGLVVHGRVAASESRWDATNTLHTYVTVDVTRVVLGSGVPARLVLKQLGGETGGIGLWVAGQAAFTANEDVLLDLAARPADGSLFTAGLARGKWRVEADAATGMDVATRRDDEGREIRLPVGDVEAALAAGRLPLTAFAAAPPEYNAVLRQPGPLFAFLPTDGGPPARWHEVDSGSAVFVDHPSALPGTWTGSTQNAVNAITLWKNSGMDLNLQNGGTFTQSGPCRALSFTGSGRISVEYNDPCGAGITDWVVGGGYYTTGDLRTVNGVEFQKFLQGFVVLGTGGVQTQSAGCFQDAITHGLGHALGLGHSDSAGAIMRPAPPCGSTPSGLGADDVTGITTIYEGIASNPNPPNTPTAFSATAQLATVTLAWTPATTGGAAQRYIIDAGTASGNYNLGSIVINAPATSTAVGSVPTGTYFVRLRAQNALGTSAPTAERSVTVGSCTVPGAPASFTGSSNDQLVSLQWTPPAAGLTQGYQLVAGSAPGLSNLAVVNFPSTVTSFGAPVPYGTYFTRLHATNVCGIGPPSQEVTLVVQPCSAPPQAPTGLARSVSGGVVTLAWTAPAGVAPTSYVVIAGSVSGGSDIVVFATGTTATSLVTPAPPGTYHVRVLATNACGQSGASNEVTVVVP